MKLTQALSRGYCSEKNCKKELDVDLIKAMEEEVIEWLQEYKKKYRKTIVKEIIQYLQEQNEEGE